MPRKSPYPQTAPKATPSKGYRSESFGDKRYGTQPFPRLADRHGYGPKNPSKRDPRLPTQEDRKAFPTPRDSQGKFPGPG